MTEASDARMTVGGFKMSPAEAQQEHARLQNNRPREDEVSGDHVCQDRPRCLTGSSLGSELKLIATTGEAAIRAGLVRGRTFTQTRVQTPRSDTSSGTDSRSPRTVDGGAR